MAVSNGGGGFHTPIIRYYIDTRPYSPINTTRRFSEAKKESEQLPLLHTLPKETQEAVARYVRKPDRYMALASALLKHLFIHRTAKVPWDQVRVQRTPKPHSRPYWAPPAGWAAENFDGLEFNVSHQAGMVVLVGCKTPGVPRDARINDQDDISISSPAVMNPDPTAIVEAECDIGADRPRDIRIGVDVACTWEPPRTPDLSTQDKLEEWVDVFGEMFSAQEQHDMKYAPLPQGHDADTDADAPNLKSRRFYTYWALKEAYIKMVGEGLLAPWLRQLEFRDVPLPETAPEGSKQPWTLMSDAEVAQLQISFNDKDIAGTMHTTLEGFETDFIVATMTRGVVEEPDPQCSRRWKDLDIFADIGPCATKRCHCLD